MDDHKTFEELIEERRAAWNRAKSPAIDGFGPVPAAQAVNAGEDLGLGELEETRPLPAYRPERL